ncbi:hypothetical protein CBM2634_B130075 [Cupriavidus taiwanensis]|uniref:Uncharacterized protein n=1 Tax=Cupriavidus taiwanensis TaxID=164546 RepID=A0A375J7P2_9BURK|nr:hypothetical protein CBM2634_B130075 [Cupriavidus taiwanensis]
MPAPAGRRARNIRQTVTAAQALAVQARDDAPLPGPDQVETRRWACPTNNSSPRRKRAAQG